MTSDTSGRDELSAFIAQQFKTSFKHGWHDCGTFLADWCEFKTGQHPWPEMRGAYASREDIPQFLNGLTPAQVVGKLARRHSYKKTKEPKRGDVGSFAVGNTIYLGVCAGSSWFTRLQGIAVCKNVRVIAAWRIE